MSEKFLTREETARYINEKGLPIAQRYLMKLASIGGGPEYRKFGRYCVYERDAVDKWVASRLSEPMTSTSAAHRRPRRKTMANG